MLGFINYTQAQAKTRESEGVGPAISRRTCARRCFWVQEWMHVWFSCFFSILSSAPFPKSHPTLSQRHFVLVMSQPGTLSSPAQLTQCQLCTWCVCVSAHGASVCLLTRCQWGARGHHCDPSFLVLYPSSISLWSLGYYVCSRLLFCLLLFWMSSSAICLVPFPLWKKHPKKPPLCP